MSSQGLRSGGVNLRGQDSTTADVAVYEFDIDSSSFHNRVRPPGSDISSYFGQWTSFPSSTFSDYRPWQTYLRFSKWQSDWEQSLTVRAWRQIPKRKPRIKVDKDKGKEKNVEDGNGEHVDASSTSSTASPATSMPVPSTASASSAPVPRHRLPYDPLHPERNPPPKTDFDDDLDDEPKERNALLVHVRLFSINYDKDPHDPESGCKLVAETTRTRQQLRVDDAEQVEIKLAAEKLKQLATRCSDDGVKSRYLRLEITTVYNHEYARTIRAWPEWTHSDELYHRVVGLSVRKPPHDLRLFFPDVGKDGAELWTNADSLADASPYYYDLFESGFAEAVTKHGKRRRLDSPPNVDVPSPGHLSSLAPAAPLVPSAPSTDPSQAKQPSSPPPPIGSANEQPAISTAPKPMEAGETAPLPPSQTDEVDEVDDPDVALDELFATKAQKLLLAEDGDAETEYRQITIRGTAWSTYRAVLAYIASSKIIFNNGECKLHQVDLASPEELPRQYAKPPYYIPPVSPLSVYRLSHLLQMDDLSAKALEAYRLQLDTRNVVTDLFGPLAAQFDEIRREARRFAVSNWHDVKRGKAMQDIRQKVAAGELPQAAPILLELLDAVSK
ncbi:hypothetical protein JCM8097_007136 [Rhodosporidiobolus ruineniae]